MSLEDEFKRIAEELKKSEDTKVKVAFIGQPGAGKSSLINALIGRNVAEVSIKTNTTKEEKIYEHQGLVFVDLPGYGTKEFTLDRWNREFETKEYDLILYIFNGKLLDSDDIFFSSLMDNNRPYFIIRSHSDNIWCNNANDKEKLYNEIKEDIWKHIGEKEKIFFVSSRTNDGIKELMDAIKNAPFSEAKREKLKEAFVAKSTEALAEKKTLCEDKLKKYAMMSAANALNPIPGVDVSIDIGVILKAFKKFREIYNLEDDELEEYAAFLPLANQILQYATKEGCIILLKKYATKQIIKEGAKYIPFVGQCVAAAAGYYITTRAGESYINDCHKIAERIMKDKTEALAEDQALA